MKIKAYIFKKKASNISFIVTAVSFFVDRELVPGLNYDKLMIRKKQTATFVFQRISSRERLQKRKDFIEEISILSIKKLCSS